MSKFNFKKFVKHILQEEINEVGYAGGPSSVDGAATFRGGPWGFGGEAQLAAELSPPVKKLKKQRDKEAVFNIEDQMKINRGYPAPQSVSGYPGGESNSGIRSGVRIPNTINSIAISAEDLDVLDFDDPTKQYWGFKNSDDRINALGGELDEDEFDESEFDLTEALGAGGGYQGPQRAVPSDGNYRDLPGYPRHNAIVKKIDYVPNLENDYDNDGEEDVYLSDEQYVDGILNANGIKISSKQKEKLLNAEKIERNFEESFDIAETKQLLERTLYHGTIIDHYDSVKEIGLVGDVGDFVKDAYGIDPDETDWDEWADNGDDIDEIVFAADKSSIENAVTAMSYHVAKKLGKPIQNVTIDDLRKHGMLVVIRDVDEEEKWRYPQDQYSDTWYNRPKSNDEYDYDEYPRTVEPGDWFIKGSVAVDDILTGNKMIRFLRRMGGFKKFDEDKRRRLIKTMIKVFGPQNQKNIVQQVLKMPIDKVEANIKNYEEVLIKRNSKANKETKKNLAPGTKSGAQLSFDFTEGKHTPPNRTKFYEMYAMPSYGPEPNKGIEPYKQGVRIDANDPDMDKKLMKHIDYSRGHQGMPPADESPGAMTYGNIIQPKKFVPDDWEQRHPQTKSIDDDRISNEQLKEKVEKAVLEIFGKIL